MNRILIKHGQTITLFLDKKETYEFLVNDIQDHVVFVMFDSKTGGLTIACCPPDMIGNVYLFLMTCGAMDDAKAASTVCWLVGSDRSSPELMKTFLDCLDAHHLKCESVVNYGHLHITQAADGSLKHENASPATDFASFDRDPDGEVTAHLQTFGLLTPDGIKTSAQNLLLATFAADDDFSSAVPDGNDEDLDFGEKVKKIGAVLDAVTRQQRSASIKGNKPDAADSKLIAAVSQQAAYPEVYLVKPWQTAVVYLGGGRKVKSSALLPTQTAVAVCDTTSRTLAISILGNEADQEYVQGVFERCLTSVSTAATQARGKPNIVYEIIALANTSPASMLRNLFNSKAQDAKQGRFGFAPGPQQYCTYESFVAEMIDGKFSITDMSKIGSMPAAYRALACSLSAAELASVKAETNPQDARRIKFKDCRSVVEASPMVELSPGLLYEARLSSMQCLFALREKTIILGSFCAHSQTLAVVQIGTDDCAKFLIDKNLTQGNWSVINALSNSPAIENAPPSEFFLWCRKAQVGHSKDSETCDKYIAAFPLFYPAFDETKSMYMSRAGTKFVLQSLAKPVKYTYEDSKGYLCFSLEGLKLKTEVRQSTQVDATKRTPFIRMPVDKQESFYKSFYKVVGIKASPVAKSAEKWTNAEETKRLRVEAEAKLTKKPK